VKWSNCKAPYPVYRDAFSNYSRGIKKGLPRSNKNSVRLATARAKKKVKNALLSVGNLEQQRYTLLYVLLDPAICNIASSIGVNARDITLCQELVRSAKKLVQRVTATSNRNRRISSDKHAVIQTAALLLMSTPPKDVTERKTSFSVRELSEFLGLSYGASQRCLVNQKETITYCRFR